MFIFILSNLIDYFSVNRRVLLCHKKFICKFSTQSSLHGIITLIRILMILYNNPDKFFNSYFNKSSHTLMKVCMTIQGAFSFLEKRNPLIGIYKYNHVKSF